MGKRGEIGKQYRQKIVELLREKEGELPVVQVREELGIQTEADRKAFERAVRELLDMKIVKIDDGKLVMIGYRKPQEITLSVGGPRFRISAPVERGRVAKLFRERLVLDLLLNFAKRRKGIGYSILRALGIIDDKE